MPSYNLRILLETIEGEKTSYITKGGTVASFVNTATDGFAISSSIAYGRITGSVSCSFQNQTKFTGDTDATKTFKQNTILSASLSGSTATGSIVFTALDSDYDRLLRYKFIGEKVTNVLGLPSDQWIYTDQVRLAADDEANIFQGNANLGNVNISDTLTFAGGSDINSDVPILIDTGSDRYIKFVDERAASIVALRMGYNEDTDVYEISGSDDFSFNIGGVNSFTSSEVNALHLTSSNFILRKNVDNGNATIIIENSNTDNETNKGAGIEFKHQDLSAGSIIAGKDAAYNTSLGTDTYDSNLKFATTNNGIGTERMRITSLGNVGIGNQSPTEKLVVNGNISASGNIIANQYIVSSSVTNLITQTKSGSTEFGDSADDTHKFTGNITASGIISASGDIFSNHINVDGGISSSGDMNFVAPNSNIYHFNKGDKAADFKFSCAGGETFFISGGALGQVGLGTNTPTTKLQVAGTTTTTNLISTTHITASGDISASGNISATGNLDIDGTSNFADDITIAENKKIIFDSSDTFIRSNTGNPEDLVISANEDIILAPDDNIQIEHGATTYAEFMGDERKFSITGEISASSTASFEYAKIGKSLIVGQSSLNGYGTVNANINDLIVNGQFSAAGSAGSAIYKLQIGDNLGMPTDEGDLNVGGELLVGASITASGNISSSGYLQAKHLILSGGSGVFTSASLAAGGGGGGSFNNFTLTADGGSNQTIEDGNTLDIAGGTNITTAVGATDTVTINLDASPSVTHITASGNISGSSTSTIQVGGNITTAATGSFGEINLDDDKRIKLGTGDDLQIYHKTALSGNHSIIEDSGTGNLIILTSKLQVKNPDNDEVMIQATEDGAVSINHDNSQKLTTSANGITVGGNVLTTAHITASGNIYANGNIVGDDSTNISGINHITASGNISASGRVTTLQVGKDSTDQIDFSTDNVIIFKTGNNNRLRLTTGALRPNSAGGIDLGNTSNPFDNLHLQGHITASGNISASGTITAEGLTITDDFDLTDDLTVNGDIRLGTNNSSRILFKDADGNYTQNSGSILKASGDALRFRNYGNFIFNQFNSDGQFTVNGTTDNDTRFRILHNAANPRVQIPTGSLLLQGGGGSGGHITASGNISASGTIESKVFNAIQGGNSSAQDLITPLTLVYLDMVTSLV
jgi:hypothetical protein